MSIFTEREHMLIKNKDVLNYVKDLNATRSKDALTIPESADYLLKFKNAYELEHHLACGTFIDIYKETNNMKPRFPYNENEINAIFEMAKEYDNYDPETEWFV